MKEKDLKLFLGSGTPQRDYKNVQKNKQYEKALPNVNDFRDKDTKCLRRELLVEEAKDWSEYIGKTVSYTQLRKFYSEAMSIKAKMKDIKGEEAFQKYDAVIGMLISKANYSMVRSPKNSNRPLFEFFNSYIPKIKNKQDFEDFVLFFEAVLGYFPKNR